MTRTSRQIIAATRRSINARVERRSPGGTKSEFRRILEQQYPDGALDTLLGIAGVDGIRNATVADLDRLMYGMAWCRAYRKPLSQFYSEFYT